MKKYLSVILFFVLFTSVFANLKGQTIEKKSFYSQALQRSNNVNVYLPPNYTSDVDVFYPVIYFFHGWGGSENSAETIMDIADSLISNNLIEPLIIVCPNGSPLPFNGSFYVNSELNGDFEDYMTNDLISWIDANYRTVSDKNHRTMMGQSMGGYACFRYGVQQKNLYRGFAAHGSAINFDLAISPIAAEIINENNPGPPYSYDFNNGLFTQFVFSMSGAFAPNENSPQTYVNPQIIEFPLDEQAEMIDTIYQKYSAFDPVHMYNLLSPSDSVAILFGAGRNDNLHLFPPNYAMRDTLDQLGLAYEYFDHTGNHGMPQAFKERALFFLDSIMTAPEQVTPTSEVGHWEFNEGAGTFTSDISGRGNHGTLINGPAWTTGIAGFALEFDGSNDKVDCGNASSLDMGTGDFTITGWFRPDADQTSYPTIIAKGAGASYDKGYWLMYKGTRLWFYVSDGNSRKNTYSNVISLSPDTWHHVAVVVDRDDVITYYVNGEESGTFDISAFDGVDITSDKSLTMGIWQSNPSTAFKGVLDRVVLFNEKLTQNEILNLISGEEEGNNQPVLVNPATADPATVVLPNSVTLNTLASDADGDTLIYNWSQLSGPGATTFSLNNTADANNTSASFSQAGVYTLRASISDGTDTISSDVEISVISQGQAILPKAHWPMDEGSGNTTEDIAGTNDGNLLGGASWINGVFEGGIAFDGTSGKIDAGNNNALDIGSNDFSVLTWLKMGSTQNNFPTIAGKGAGASYDQGYWLILRNSRLWFYVSDGNTRLQSYSDVLNLNPDTWYHIAVSFDRDELVSFYVDGELLGTFDLSAFDGKDITSAKSLSIASWGGSGFSFLNGAMDDFRLYEDALTEAEINEVISGEPGPEPDPEPNEPPVILIDANAMPDTLFITGTTTLNVSASDIDGDTLTYSWVKVSGAGEVTFTPDNGNNSQASFSAEDEYTLRVYITDGIDSVFSDVNVLVESVPPPPEEITPIAHWPMDEGSGTTTADSVGNNDATLVNGTNWVTGISGYANDFDGINDRNISGNGSDLDIGLGDFTLSSWLKMGSSQKTNPSIIAKGALSTTDEGYWFISRTDLLRVYISDGTSRIKISSNNISIGDNSWHHIAFTLDRDDLLTFYLDGAAVGTADISSYDGISINSTNNLSIGSNGTKSNTHFNGVIDDLRIYDNALSATEVQDLHDMYAANKSSEYQAGDVTKNEILVYPNPASTALNIKFSLKSAQKVNIRLFNMNGMLVTEIFDGYLDAGNQNINWVNRLSGSIPTGMYILRHVSESQSQTQLVIFK